MDYRETYKHWLESADIDAATRKELEEMAEEAFNVPLSGGK